MNDLRKFNDDSFLFTLEEDQVEELFEKAKGGDPLACYKYGRFLYCTRREPTSLGEAQGYLLKAAQGDVADAYAALSCYPRLGHDGIVNHYKAKQLLTKALELGSELAVSIYIRDLIEGWGYKEKNPEKAIELLREVMKTNDNPEWYLLMGLAYQEAKGLSAACEWYEKAMKAGCDRAYYFYAVSATHNDDYGLLDEERYKELLFAAVKRGDNLACYAFNIENMASLNEYDPETQAQIRELTIESLELSSDFGFSPATLCLGEYYQYGAKGIDVDLERAKKWYSLGVIQENHYCCERLYTMLKEQGCPDEEIEMYALYGARYGSREMLLACVDLYRNGLLTPYAAEIEQYYLPIYDRIEEELAENVALEEYPDDDGRYNSYA